MNVPKRSLGTRKTNETPWIARLAAVHRDERGTMSIVTVFTVLLLTMLLGMVMNLGREVDGKIRMQNAADAAAYSGGLVIARGMNTLAFTNHLLSDVFALTAFMREARDRNSAGHVPTILAAWNEMAPQFRRAPFPKLARLATAIPQKTPLEQNVVNAFSDWGAASSEQILPLLERILSEELIPKYQRAVVETFPDIAQRAAMASANRNGQPEFGRGPMLGVLWRTSGAPVGFDDEAVQRTLPVVDSVEDVVDNRETYARTARRQRRELATHYLRDWNNEALCFFDGEAKMCQFGNLWRSYTCGYLEKLLEEEYPNTNLPHVIRTRADDLADAGDHLETYFTFVAVVYWRDLPKLLPRLFVNPTGRDAVAFAQVRVFLPHRRLIWVHLGSSGSSGPGSISIGGMPGDFPTLPSDPPTGPEGGGTDSRWVVGRQGVPTDWNLLNQHWNAQLVPATAQNLATILQTEPPVPEFAEARLTLPNLGSLSSEEIRWINSH